MAVEAKRGCGYRKAGGLYLVGGGIGLPCDRLPYEIHECPCCHMSVLGEKPAKGIKQTIANLQWLDIGKYVREPHLVSRTIPAGKSYHHDGGNGHEHDEPAQLARTVCDEALKQSCTFCADPNLMGE